MICDRCNNYVSDESDVCPICGNIIEIEKSRRILIAPYIMTAADLLVIIMSFINAIFLILSVHYATDLNTSTGFTLPLYLFIPFMPTIDLIYGLTLIPIPLLSILGKYEMRHVKESGLTKMTIAHCALFVWSVTYPVLCFIITGTVSPIWIFTICQIAVYSLLSAATLIYLWSSRHIIF